jgi:hypothetical protein
VKIKAVREGMWSGRSKIEEKMHEGERKGERERGVGREADNMDERSQRDWESRTDKNCWKDGNTVHVYWAVSTYQLMQEDP